MYVTSVNKDFSALTGTSQNVQVFKLVGQVELISLWGIVTTALGSTHTGSYFNLYDGTNTSNITLSTGLTLSNYPAGGLFEKCGLSSRALRGLSGASVAQQEYDTAGAYTGGFEVLGQGGSNDTYIRFAFTSNNPAVGAIKFYIKWVPVMPGSYIAVA